MRIESSQIDSQQQLARSWARRLRADFPQAGEEAQLAELIESALRQDSSGFERTVAYLRAGFLGVVLIFSGMGVFFPRVASLDQYPVLLLAVVALCFAAAVGFCRVLQGGWYHPRIRKLAPVADALLITILFGLMYHNMRVVWLRAPIGMVALTAITCGFVAFSGSLRLARKSGLVSTSAALAAWVATSVIVSLPVFESLLIAMMIAVIGILAGRLTQLARRGVSNQIVMLRFGSLYDDARQAVTVREDMLKIVSHDLRNPLSTISMTADLIRDLDVPPSERNRYLDMITRAGERMNRLIQDLLDVARIQQGGITVNLQPARLVDIVNDAMEMMMPLAFQSNVALRTDIPAHLPFVKADAERIVQLFSNLIGNALKFTPAGGTVWIAAQHTGNKVRVSVKDTGPGIPPEHIDNIFVSIWQATKGDRRGIGYGLKIVRAIIEAHGERIGVESSPGEGAEFWFTLSVAS